MSPIEKKLDAIMRHLTADNEKDREQAREDMRDLMADDVRSAPPAEQNIESEVRRVLLELGVPDHIKGHRYLVFAICITVKEPDLVDAITRELYPQVAAAFSTTSSRVERAIRHAIELCWDRGDLYVLARYFGNTVSAAKGKPTNSEFIARIANVIRQRVGE